MRKYLCMLCLSTFLSLTTVQSVGAVESSIRSFSTDAEVVKNARKAMQDILAYTTTQPELFPLEESASGRLTSQEQRQMIWQTWKMFLDRVLVLDDIGQRYDVLYRNAAKKDRSATFHIGYAAFLAQYRYAMDFIAIMENDPAMHTTLNEPVVELGIKKGSYKELKFRFLNVLRGAEFARLDALSHFYDQETAFGLSQGIAQDSRAIWQAGKGSGPKYTAKNALRIIQDAGFTVWFPLQKGVSEWMGDVKVMRTKQSLISKEQIKAMQSQLLPGDILLVRREWYLSNIGLPGYWPHAAIYIGTAEERQNYFDDAQVKARYKKNSGSLDEYLKQRYPAAYALGIRPQQHGHAPRVLEAISEGVSFTTLEHSVDADSVVILRPRLSKVEKAAAIERAYYYSGRPYDFNFDFLTDAELVCTELVYKAYEPHKAYRGLTFPLQEIVGRKVTTANDIAHMFDEEYGQSRQQLDFIAFYDGHERMNKAVVSDVKAFRQSWKRPKWFIWVQDTSYQALGTRD